ncbi:MAG: flagellar basal-body rod protein FlgF [Candidatus Kapabacteria bacterium]|nr:flagellar basal-body rod protein FlgF [Ignavibacteriota bacterium]MCW5885775.1 flagellar basal-body rod protein FlgF [Candidatus Kapabacteria bacterium]
MVKEIFTAALGMQSQMTRLEVTANNIANASTPGYKRATVFERNLIEAGNNFQNIEGDVEQRDIPATQYYDFSQGDMRFTENPFDLAIEGDGFFTLTDEGDNKYLTRAGNFRLSGDGIITSMDGKKLMGADGPISLQREFFSRHAVTGDNTSRSIRIAQTGEVFVNDFEIGRIAVVIPEDMAKLERMENSLFKPIDDVELQEVESALTSIRQGWLEGSNVNIVQEMVQMIEIQRYYDVGSKIIQTNDNTLEKSIGLGRFY